MVGRAVGYGALTGGALGVLVMLGFGAVDATEYDLADLAAVLVVFVPLALGFGAVIGLVEALLAVAAVLALGTLVAGRPNRARSVAAAAAAVPGLVGIGWGVSLPVGIPFVLASAVTAALLTRRVIGATR